MGISASASREHKKEIGQKNGLAPEKQKVLFRGNEKDDKQCFDTVGMQRQPTEENVEDKANEGITESEEMKEIEEMSKAFAAVSAVRSEVDKLAERVSALEVAVNSGIKVSDDEFAVSAELLMRQLLKLDGIDAEGEARLQRKAEVRRVQSFHETLDNLKARNSNPFNDSGKTATATTNSETFDNGIGSSPPPPPPPPNPSSTNVTEDCERCD